MMGNSVGHFARNQSDARTCAHSEGPASAGQNTVARYIYFARSAFGVRCVSASLSCRHTDFGFRGRCSFFLWHERALRRNRMMALQPNQKIKNPHPPADWKTVTDISAKHCVHGWRKAEHIARREENFVESVGALFTAEHGEENPAAKNRIDKACGIACKQPAVAV